MLARRGAPRPRSEGKNRGEASPPVTGRISAGLRDTLIPRQTEKPRGRRGFTKTLWRLFRSRGGFGGLPLLFLHQRRTFPDALAQVGQLGAADIAFALNFDLLHAW